MTGFANSALVLAYGNPLRGDDGAAWRIAEALEEHPLNAGTEVICAQQLMPEHAAALSRAEAAVFLDCSAIHDPGAVTVTPLSTAHDLPRIFTHHLDPASLLRLALDLYGRAPARAFAVTVGGQSYGFGDGLSGTVTAAIPAAVDAVCRVLRSGEIASHVAELPHDETFSKLPAVSRKLL